MTPVTSPSASAWNSQAFGAYAEKCREVVAGGYAGFACSAAD
jgi:hypothetical protein